MRFFLYALALFALGAAPAHADPVSAIASVFIMAGASPFAAVAIARVAIGVGLHVLGTAIASAMAKKPGVGADVKLDVEFGDDAQLSFTVGSFATAGKRKYIGSWGRNTRFVTEVIEVSCLPQGFGAIWVDNAKANPASGLIGTVPAAEAPGSVSNQIDVAATSLPAGQISIGTPLDTYADDGHRVYIKWLDGTQTAADPFLIWAFGADEDHPWSAEMIGTGKSYAIVTWRYDSDTTQSYPSYLIEPAPLPVYDPRRDSTAGGSGPQRWGDRSTYAPSTNAQVIAYNVVRGIYLGSEWIFGGRNLPGWRLPLAEWMAAMNECDAAVALDGGGTEPAYRCGYQVSVGDLTGADLLEEIGRASNTRYAEVGGRLKPVTGLPGAAVFGITDGDIVITQGQSLTPFNPLTDTYNALSATYPEPAEKWATKDAPEYIDDEAMAADGGRYLPTSIQYAAAPYAQQVQRLMRAQMRDFRRMRRHQFQLPPDAYALEPLDMISWSSERNGYANKQFVVETVSKMAGMNVAVTLREVDPGDYDWSSDWEVPVTVTIPGNVIPWVQPIAGFAAVGVTVAGDDGQERAAIRVSCDGSEAGVSAIRIRARRLGESDPQVDVTRPYDAPHQWLIVDVLPATQYQVQAQLLSDITPKSAWSAWITLTTPDVRISLSDLEQDLRDWLEEMQDWIDGGGSGSLPAELAALADQIAAEQADRVADAQLAAARWRKTRETVRALQAQAVELASASHAARDEIRRSLAVQLGDLRAAYDEQIVTLADADMAAVLRIETLEVTAADSQARIQQVAQAQVDGDEALAALITGLAVGNATQFDQARIWYFDASAEGWTGAPSDPVAVAGGLIRPANGAGGYIVSPDGLSVDAARYSQVRLRVERTGSPAWTGYLWWAGASEGWSTARRVAISEPVWAADEGLISIVPGWSGSIDRIRLDLADNTASDGVAVDWIAIGRPAPGASSADLSALQQAMTDADEALAQDVVQLQADLTDQAGAVSGLGSALSGLQSRVTATEDGIEVLSEDMTALQSRVSDPATGLDALADAIDQIATETQTGDGSQLVQSAAIRALTSQLRAMRAEGVEGAARDHLGRQDLRDYIAQASQSLSTRIELTDEQVTIVAEAVTALKAAIPGLATADALQALRTVVTQQGDSISANSTWLTNLQAGLDNLTTVVGGKASSSALNALTARVSDAEGDISTQAGQITSLQSGLTTTNNTVATKASTTALNALTTRVTAAEGNITSQADAQTTLNASVNQFAASGLFRIGVEATPSGALSRIGLKASATAAEATSARSAAMFMEAIPNGKSRVAFVADQFVIQQDGVSYLPFIVDGGVVYLNSARIKTASIDTLMIAGNAVTVPVTATGVKVFGGSGLQLLVSVTVNLPANTPVLILWSVEHSYSAQRAWDLQITRGSTVLKERYNMNYGNDWPSGMLLDTYAGAGNRTYNLRWAGATNHIDAIGSLVILGVKR